MNVHNHLINNPALIINQTDLLLFKCVQRGQLPVDPVITECSTIWCRDCYTNRQVVNECPRIICLGGHGEASSLNYQLEKIRIRCAVANCNSTYNVVYLHNHMHRQHPGASNPVIPPDLQPVAEQDQLPVAH